MGVTVQSAKAQVKTGKSCAIRCVDCGEATIADHFISQVMSNVKYQGIQVSSSLEEKGDSVYCRLCGSVQPIPNGANPVTWEEFDLALASDELIDRTNPSAREAVVPPRHAIPNRVARPVASLLEYLRKNRNPGEVPPLPLIIIVGGIVAAFAAGTAVKSATHSAVVGVVAGIMIAAGAVVAGVIVNFKHSVDMMADKHGSFVCRFLNEMNMELNQLTDACTAMGPKYAKVAAILNRIPEFYDV